MNNKLRFNEEIMLALYLEVFKEYYNKEENKYNDKYNITINEGKMQCVCYIFQNLHLFDHEYGFSLNWYIPYSPGVLALSNDINKKENSVNQFYDEYYEKRKDYDGSIYKSLSKYFSQEEINRIINITNILEEIKDDELGIELLSILHFFIKTKYVGSMTENYYKEKIEESYPIYANREELFEKSYKTLYALSLINKSRTDIPKRIRKK